MDEAREGGCQCGAVRYRLRGEPISLAICHCKECQRQSGSAFGMSLTVRKEDFELIKGNVKTFDRPADSGRIVTCAFCPDCGTRIYHAPHYRKDALNIKPGTFDDTSFLAPKYEVWKKRKHAWVKVLGEIVSFDDQPG